MTKPDLRIVSSVMLLGGLPVHCALAQPARSDQVNVPRFVEEVICLAGCPSRPGEVIARAYVPKVDETASKASGWRNVARYMWCHDDYGCRSTNTILPRRVECQRSYSGSSTYVSCVRY